MASNIPSRTRNSAQSPSSLPLTDTDLERSLIAVALHDFGKFTARGVVPEDFGDHECRTIFELATAVHADGGHVTHHAIIASVKHPARAMELAPKLASYRATVAPDHDRLRHLRRLRDVRENALYAASKTEVGELDEAVAALEGAQRAAIARDGTDTVLSIDELSMRFLERLRDQANTRHVHLGMPLFSKATGPLAPGSMTIIGADTNVGKALRSTEPVLTPCGWVPIGQLAVGDLVVSAAGSATQVTGVFPQGKREIYRVRFDDGATVDADLEHRWAVATDNDRDRKRPFRVMTTREIIASGMVDSCGRVRWRVPTVQPVEHPEANLPVDPYLLGVLLGDGSLREATVGLTKKYDHEVLERCASALPKGVALVREAGSAGDGDGYRLCAQRGQPNALVRAMRSLGLMGRGSRDKFVPAAYLTASIAQRSEILRGLLDTDGTVDATGRYLGYSTTSPQLRDAVLTLVRSLGGMGRVCERYTHYTHNGEKRAGALSYVVSIAMPPEFRPFHCKRKADRFKPRTCRMPTRKIVAVDFVDVDDAVCISVAHPSKLYVTKDYVVTHNTGYALELLASTVVAGTKCGFISCEDPEDIVVPRLIASYSEGLTSRAMQMGTIDRGTHAKLETALNAMLGKLSCGLFMSFPIGGTELDVCGEMSRMVSKGAKVIAVDYIQTIEPSKRQQDRRNEIRWMAARLKEQANRLKVPLILLSQLTIPPGAPPGWEPTKIALKECRDLANASEVVVLLWRQDDFDGAPVMAKLDKSKVGNVGATWSIQRDGNAVVREVPDSYLSGFDNFKRRQQMNQAQPAQKGWNK